MSCQTEQAEQTETLERLGQMQLDLKQEMVMEKKLLLKQFECQQILNKLVENANEKWNKEIDQKKRETDRMLRKIAALPKGGPEP